MSPHIMLFAVTNTPVGANANGLGHGTLCLEANGEGNSYYHFFLERYLGVQTKGRRASQQWTTSPAVIEKSIIALAGNNALW